MVAFFSPGPWRAGYSSADLAMIAAVTIATVLLIALLYGPMLAISFDRAFAASLGLPVRALDAVYVRGGVRIRSIYRSHLRLARQASDHLPLFAEIEFL